MKKIMMSFFGVVFVGMIAISCAPLEEKASNSANTTVAEFTGTLLDKATNQPVDDVLVTIELRSDHAYTNDDGEFVMYLRPRNIPGETDFVWAEDLMVHFSREDYQGWVDGKTDTSFAIAKKVTIERGRTTVILVEIYQ